VLKIFVIGVIFVVAVLVVFFFSPYLVEFPNSAQVEAWGLQNRLFAFGLGVSVGAVICLIESLR